MERKVTALKLAAIFSDNMVLQRDREVRVFGETDKEEIISISIDNIQISEKIAPGRWEVVLPPHEAGGPYDMVISIYPNGEYDNNKSCVNSSDNNTIDQSYSYKKCLCFLMQ